VNEYITNQRNNIVQRRKMVQQIVTPSTSSTSHWNFKHTHTSNYWN